MTKVSIILADVSEFMAEAYSDVVYSVVYSSTDHELVVRRFKEAVINYVDENREGASVTFPGNDRGYAEASYDGDVFATFEIHTFTLND